MMPTRPWLPCCVRWSCAASPQWVPVLHLAGGGCAAWSWWPGARALYGAGVSEKPFLAEGGDHLACGVCPARRLPREQFVVYDRPTRAAPFNPEDGYRYADDGQLPACVHPHKVGLLPDRQAPPPEPVVPKAQRSATPAKRPWWQVLRRRTG